MRVFDSVNVLEGHCTVNHYGSKHKYLLGPVMSYISLFNYLSSLLYRTNTTSVNIMYMYISIHNLNCIKNITYTEVMGDLIKVNGSIR